MQSNWRERMIETERKREKSQSKIESERKKEKSESKIERGRKGMLELP